MVSSSIFGKRTWRVECRLPLAGLLHPIRADQRNGTGLGLPKSRGPEDAATTKPEVHPRGEPNAMIRHAPRTTAVPVTHRSRSAAGPPRAASHGQPFGVRLPRLQRRTAVYLASAGQEST